MIPVTKPFLPPIEEYQKLLEGIWERNWLNGPQVVQLEGQLKEYLNVENLLYVSSGTIALQLAIKALGLRGEIITTPFSYVATTSSIVWEGCQPVFVDIDPDTLNLNPKLIEAAITEKTSAIIATHVFGNPCDIEAIQEIATKYGLKVIYDGAHAFGSKLKEKSVFNYGDISITSFHATKLFHTVEGGALFTKDPELALRIKYLRNFGHDGEGKFNGLGINGKNSELHAAMGLVNFRYITSLLEKRKEVYQLYESELKELGIFLPKVGTNCTTNYAYAPIVFNSTEQMLITKQSLEKNDIYPRRYFYPGLNNLEYVKEQSVTISDDISHRVICLPTYFTLKTDEQKKICNIISDSMKYKEICFSLSFENRKL